MNGCRNLKAISLQGTNSLSDHSFQYISQLKKLRKIRVEGNHLSQTDCYRNNTSDEKSILS